jgi:hypothetical protein
MFQINFIAICFKQFPFFLYVLQFKSSQCYLMLPLQNMYMLPAKCTIQELYTIPRHFIQVKKKGKGVPLHAMEAHGGRGSIAPTQTKPRH